MQHTDEVPRNATLSDAMVAAITTDTQMDRATEHDEDEKPYKTPLQAARQANNTALKRAQKQKETEEQRAARLAAGRLRTEAARRETYASAGAAADPVLADPHNKLRNTWRNFLHEDETLDEWHRRNAKVSRQ